MIAPRYVHDGCATQWPKCPHADPVAVVFPRHRLTSCIEREELQRLLAIEIQVRP